jgi:uncharacterized phage protein (TIGR02218 family)
VAYADDVRSRRSGAPRHLFLFTGALRSYRYTSNDQPIVFDGNLYSPLADLKAGNIGSQSTNDTSALEVTMPVSAQLALDYGFDNPPQLLRLTLYEQQERSLDYAAIWRGDVVGIEPVGRRAKLRSVSKCAERLGTIVPSVAIGKTCNHFLYDARCRVERATFDFTALITAVGATSITINSIGIAPDQWFRAGEIVRDVDGERRTIIDQIGAVLKLASPFPNLASGDAVTLYAGCDHTFVTCEDKFNNGVNFGGHPAMPLSNPFKTPFRLLGET